MTQLGKWIGFAVTLVLANLGRLRAPYKYFVVVTKKCNSRCRNCLIWLAPTDDELSLEDYGRLAANSPNLRWLTITGGEATERDDFVEIVATFVRLCPKLTLLNFTTNGLEPERIEKMARLIAAFDLPYLAINVSLDGPAAVHDHLRGKAGGFELALETFVRLKRIDGIAVRAGMTLFEQNTDLIDQTIEQIRTRVPKFSRRHLHLNVPHVSEHYYGNAQSKVDIAPNLAARIEDFLNELPRFVSPTAFLEKRYLQNALEYLRTKKSPLPCSSLASSIYVSERGDVYPCTIWNRKVSSLRDHDWNVGRLVASSDYVETRKAIAKGNCPQCWTPCEAYQTILSNVVRS